MTIVTEVDPHCNMPPFYQGYLVMRHVTEQRRTFQFQGRFAKWHVQNQNVFYSITFQNVTFYMTAGLRKEFIWSFW